MPASTLATDYSEARGRFLDAARGAGAHVEHRPHPRRGPAGEALAVDIARIGRADAPARLLVISGTHGVEGFAGSVCQHAWLAGDEARGLDRTGDLAVVLVHAINPFGFAWIRRVNEDNVDLNRNCVDFGAPLPENPGYDELAEAIVPRTWDRATQAATTERLIAYAAEHGFDRLQEAFTAGQYRHPTGVYFGGRGPVWSQRALAAVVGDHLAGASRVAVLDLHTGLGPFGVAELIAGHPAAPAKGRLQQWYGEFTVPAEGTSVSSDVQGDILDGIDTWLAGAEVTGVAIEWGTIDIVEVGNALRADAWLHSQGDLSGPEAEPIKRQLREAFAPEDPEWVDAVRARFGDVARRATDGLVA